MKNRNLAGSLFSKTPLTATETSVSATIGEFLDRQGIFNLRLNSGKICTKNGHWVHLCPAGTPDRLAVYKGFAVFIEVKKRGEGLSPEQVVKHQEIIKSKAYVVTAYEVEDVKKVFANIDQFLN